MIFRQRALKYPAATVFITTSSYYGHINMTTMIMRTDGDPRRYVPALPCLFQLGQFLRGQLSRFAGIFFLDLLVEPLGFERLVGVLVQFGQLQLCRYFADGGRGLFDQFLIKSSSFFRTVRLSVQRGQGTLGNGRNFTVARGSHQLETALGSRVVQ